MSQLAELQKSERLEFVTLVAGGQNFCIEINRSGKFVAGRP